MTWSVSADPVDFDEAIAWFRKRVSMSKAEFRRLSAASKRKAFAVANVAQLDLVNHVFKAIDDALKKGTSLEDFKKAVGGDLRKAWKGSVDDPAWRLETIFRTNVQLAYGAGRFRQAKHPDVVGDRPVWMFDAILDGRETEVCHAADGTKLPSDHKWWETHTPPLHYNCRSSFIALTEKQAGKITLHPPTKPPQKGFGLPPGDDEWEPDDADYPAALWDELQAKQKAAPPPPPPSKIVDGKHAKKVVVARGVTKAAAGDLMASIDDAETLKYLEANPLDELAFRKMARIGRKPVNGWWDSTPRLEVTVDRPSHTFGKTFDPGVVHSISSSATTKEAAAKATLRHELGHHVHLHDQSANVDKLVREAYTRARAADRFITRYAKSSYAEYFAESYAAYYLRRSALRSHDPNGLKMVEDVLKERGILP